MLLGTKFKAPLDVKRYVIDYTDWLDTGETLVSVVFTPDSGITITGDAVSGASAVFFVNGGVAGTTYNLDVQVTTTVGQVKDDHVVFEVVAP